jgi:hypothetical protein
VAALLGEDELSRLGEEPDGDLVGHGSAGHEKAGLEAQLGATACCRRLTVGSSP